MNGKYNILNIINVLLNFSLSRIASKNVGLDPKCVNPFQYLRKISRFVICKLYANFVSTPLLKFDLVLLIVKCNNLIFYRLMEVYRRPTWNLHWMFLSPKQNKVQDTEIEYLSGVLN